MARDPRKDSAFSSGLRGREKPKVQGAHGGTFGQENAGTSAAGGEHKQGASTTVGNPDGVNLNDSAYSSGMRGMEKSSQKSGASATFGQQREGSGGGENKQGPDTQVGKPDGHNDAERGPTKGVMDSHIKSAAEDAHKMGAAGSNNSTEHAASQSHPTGGDEAGILGEEDDTHINIRIPKASLKRKAPGLQTS